MSSPSIPGFIVATGNEGQYLSRNLTNTYMSDDGGVTWRLLIKGNHIYDIGDQGGLIVLAPSGTPTTYILFSWDMGRSLNKMTVHHEPFYVSRIKADQDNKGLLVIVQGVQDSDHHQGIVISLEFSNLMPRLCEVDSLADFEVWTPVFKGEE